MKKIYLFALTCAAALFASCDNDNRDYTPVNGTFEAQPFERIATVDAQATDETKSLQNYLWNVRGQGVLFGHHDDLAYGRTWIDQSGRSDTKDVCGDFPAIYAFDLAAMVEPREGDVENYDAITTRSIVEAYDRGMILFASMHLGNPLTGGTAWDNSSDQVVKEILTEGSEVRDNFNNWLDNLADYVSNLRGTDGKLIPIIFRPFHEHNQDWSWWSKKCTTEEEYIGLWRYTVEYLRDTKGVHNLLYAISPQLDSAQNEGQALFRWPGDDYVDVMGMDCYPGTNGNAFLSNIKTLVSAAQSKKKPCGVSETGIEGFQIDDYWTHDILAPMTARDINGDYCTREISFLMTWRNKYSPANDDQHFFSVFPGHVSADDFVKFYESPLTIFNGDLEDVYTQP